MKYKVNLKGYTGRSNFQMDRAVSWWDTNKKAYKYLYLELDL